MSPREPSVYAALPATIMGFAEGLGLERGALLAAAGVDEAALADPDELVSYESLIGVWSLLLARFPDLPLGLRYAQVVPMTTFGALGYAMAHSATGREAMRHYLRYSRLIDPFIEVELKTLGDRVRIVIDHEPRVRAMPEVMEMLVGATHRHARELVFGADTPPPEGLEVSFSHPRRHPRALYAEFFGEIPLCFEAEYDGTELPAHLLDLPIREADPRLGRHLIASLEAQLSSHEDTSPRFSDQVRHHIEAQLLEGAPNQTDVAAAMHVAPRTLQRRLLDEGARFSDLLDDVRRRRALRLLAEPSLSVQEVAYLLGYAEPRAFHRSFRRWTGASAGAWRRARGDR